MFTIHVMDWTKTAVLDFFVSRAFYVFSVMNCLHNVSEMKMPQRHEMLENNKKLETGKSQ